MAPIATRPSIAHARMLRTALLTLVLLLAGRGTRAQGPGGELVGVMLDDSGEPLPFANVVAPNSRRSVLADAHGRFAIRGLPAGPQEFVFRQIGFAPVRRTLAARASGSPVLDTIRLVRLPLLFDAVLVVSDVACTRGGFDAAQGPQVRALFDLARENAEQYRAMSTQYPVRYRLARTRRYLKANGRIAGERTDTLVQRTDERSPYAVGEVLAVRDGNLELRVPSLADVAEPAFQAAHCFRYAGTDTLAGRAVHRVEFTPTARVTTPDAAGTLYLDATTGLLRRGVFRLVQLPRKGLHVASAEVATTYLEVQPYVLLPGAVSTVQALRNVDFRGVAVARQTDDRILLDHVLVDPGAPPGEQRP